MYGEGKSSKIMNSEEHDRRPHRSANQLSGAVPEKGHSGWSCKRKSAAKGAIEENVPGGRIKLVTKKREEYSRSEREYDACWTHIPNDGGKILGWVS